MTTILRNILFISLIGLLVKCNEEEITSRDYPRIKTYEADTLSDLEVKLRAEISYRANFEIINHGFVWGTSKLPNFSDGGKIDLGSDPQSDHFYTTLDSGLYLGTTFYARPFVQTKEYLVYGAAVSFNGKGYNIPQIHDFDPKSGSEKTVITIYGKNFSTILEENKVSFGGKKAIVLQALPNEIQVLVPRFLERKEVDISIICFGQETTAENVFQVYYPWKFLGKLPFSGIDPWFDQFIASFVFDKSAFFFQHHSKDAFKYNSETNIWTKFYLPSPTLGFCYVIDGKGYVELEGGVYQYDPATKDWTLGTDIPDNFGAKYGLSTNQFGTWLFDPVNHELITTGGTYEASYGFSTPERSFGGAPFSGNFNEYLFDLNSWIEREPIPGKEGGIRYSAALTIEGVPYHGLGHCCVSTWIKEMWRYNRTNDTWDELPPSPLISGSFYSFSIGKKGYIIDHGLNLFEFDTSQITF